jgi:hypothetical protein
MGPLFQLWRFCGQNDNLKILVLVKNPNIISLQCAVTQIQQQLAGLSNDWLM